MTVATYCRLLRRLVAEDRAKALKHDRGTHMAGWYDGRADAFAIVADGLAAALAGTVLTDGQFCEHCPTNGGRCVVCTDVLSPA